MMGVDLFIAFDNFVTFFPTSERKLLPVANPLDTYDEMTFQERYRLSKSVMQCLMDELNVKLHLFINTFRFIHKFVYNDKKMAHRPN